MKVYYYSEKTGKKYDTEDECRLAEMEYDERLEKERAEKERAESEKAARREEIESIFNAIDELDKKMHELQMKSDELINKYCDDYGRLDLDGGIPLRVLLKSFDTIFG